MTHAEAAILGLVQALTEFLPVSSSGHLRLARGLFGLEGGGNIVFDVMLHIGTLVAVFWVYRARIAALAEDALSGIRRGDGLLASDGAKLVVLLVIATIPTGIMGVLGSDFIDSDFFDTRSVGALLLLNGVILYFSRRAAQGASEDGDNGGDSSGLTYASLGVVAALAIGVMQGLAILPGISRAGITIVTALILGADRERAGEFSFFLSIPAILGAMALEAPEAIAEIGHGDWTVYAIGVIVSAAMGVLALGALLSMLRKAQMYRFAWYCWIVGGLAVGWTFYADIV